MRGSNSPSILSAHRRLGSRRLVRDGMGQRVYPEPFGLYAFCPLCTSAPPGSSESPHGATNAPEAPALGGAGPFC